MEDQGITKPWETREACRRRRHGAPGGETLIRRASRWPEEPKETVRVHVRTHTGLADAGSGQLERHRELLKELGGAYREVWRPDPTAGLLNIRSGRARTQLVLGRVNDRDGHTCPGVGNQQRQSVKRA